MAQPKLPFLSRVRAGRAYITGSYSRCNGPLSGDAAAYSTSGISLGTSGLEIQVRDFDGQLQDLIFNYYITH